MFLSVDNFCGLDERRILIETIAKWRMGMVGHLIRHSNWFTILIEGTIEGRRGRGRPRQEYMDEINEGRRYVVIKRLFSKGKIL